MAIEKKQLRELVGKNVLTKEGKRLGAVRDITFETRTGELIQLILSEATPHALNLGLEKNKSKELLVPYNAVIAIGDFVVVSEEDII